MLIVLLAIFVFNLVVKAVASFLTGFLVMIALHFTSNPAWHLGYWDCFWITLAVSVMTSVAAVPLKSNDS